MTKSILALIVFCIMSTAIAYFMHRMIKNYLYACVTSGILSSIIYQVAGFVVLGYLDPFILIALAIGYVIAFFIAIIAGIPIALKRKATLSEHRIDEENP